MQRLAGFDPSGPFAYMEKIINEYLEWKGTYAKRASINYRIWLDRFIIVCGNKPLSEYTVSDIVKYKLWLESRFGPYTVQFATIVIKNFLQYCRTNNYPCLSPTFIRLSRVNAKSHRAVTEEEYQRIISEIPQNTFGNIRDLLIVHLLWNTGVRVSELCDLDLSQIDEHKHLAIIQTKKTGKQRSIVWSEETHKLLIKYMKTRLEVASTHPTNALFVGFRKGSGWASRLTSRSVERIIKFYVRKADIKEKITPHSFRHGWAHKRRDQNAPLAFIQRGLGHLNPVSTFIYEQYSDREFERNAEQYLCG